MSEVKRYDISAFGGMSMDECTDGAYVNYYDYAELEAKCASLAAENAVIKSAIPEPRDIEYDNDNIDDVSLAENFGFNHAIELMRRRIPETPATDAFLDEVRASELDSLAGIAETMLVKLSNQQCSSDMHEVVGWKMVLQQASKRAANIRKVGEKK